VKATILILHLMLCEVRTTPRHVPCIEADMEINRQNDNKLMPVERRTLRNRC